MVGDNLAVDLPVYETGNFLWCSARKQFFIEQGHTFAVMLGDFCQFSCRIKYLGVSPDLPVSIAGCGSYFSVFMVCGEFSMRPAPSIVSLCFQTAVFKIHQEWTVFYSSFVSDFS